MGSRQAQAFQSLLLPVPLCQTIAKTARETRLLPPKTATRLQSKVKTPKTPCPKICSRSGILCIVPTLVILQRDDAN